MPRRPGDQRYELVAERPNGATLRQPFSTEAQLLEALRRLAPLVPADATWSCKDHG